MPPVVRDVDPGSGLARYRIASPHPAEIPIQRREYLDFYLTPPQGGVNAQTVPVLVLLGFGETANSEYYASLHRSFAEKRNWLVITVNHIGARSFKFETLAPKIEKWNEERIDRVHRQKGLPPVPFESMRKGDFSRNLLRYLKSLPAHLNTPESPLMSVTLVPPPGEHFDAGLIQAMDCLWAVRAAQAEYPNARWRHLTVAGSSHGGYLAALLAKLAPNTFSLVISSDSYIRVHMAAALKERTPIATKQVEGIHYDLHREDYWTMNPASPFYFSEDRQLIRLLADDGHLAQWRRQQRSRKPLFVFTHVANDAIHPRREKDYLIEKMRALGFELEYYTAPDGRHRVLDQGLRKSLKGLVFDFLTEERLAKADAGQADDFELKSRITYPCFNGTYVIDFGPEMPVCEWAGK